MKTVTPHDGRDGGNRAAGYGNGHGSSQPENAKRLNPDHAATDRAVPGAVGSRSSTGPGEPTDEMLLSAHQHGDEASFNKLVERYHRELFHFLVRFMGNRAAAEDVFQETFLQIHQSANTFDLSRRFRPWLFTIAANKARDLIRSQARRPTSPLQASISSGDSDSGEFLDLMQSAAAMPDENIQKEELQESVRKTVMAMPQHLREILLLSYFHQFPYKQIGDILDIPLGTVKSRLHAAVAHFADRWRANHPNPLAS